MSGKGEMTRAAILDEAVQVAARVGFSGLSIGGLAGQVEMSKSGLFAHFRSKEQLQLQTMDRARQRFVDVVVRPALAAPRGEARVRAVFDRWLVWARQSMDAGCIFVAAAAELDDRPGPLRDALVANERDWLELRRWPDMRYYGIVPHRWFETNAAMGLQLRWPPSPEEINNNDLLTPDLAQEVYVRR